MGLSTTTQLARIFYLKYSCPAERCRVSLDRNCRHPVQVYAIGNPFGLDHTLTQGIISGLGRELQTPGPRGLPLRNVIQTDAAINPGS